LANVQHSTLSDPNLHEPKGASTAAANGVYLSNGSGSGAWTAVNRLPGTGWGQYTNATYVGTNALAVSTSDVLIPFDTAANVTQLPISLTGTTSALMNLSTETLQFVSVGDLHSLTITATIYSASGAPPNMDFMLYGSSDGTTYATLLGESTVTLKGSPAGQVITESALFPVTANMVSHGARIYANATSGTINLINIGLITARVHKAR
jgi:hypothetical protein